MHTIWAATSFAHTLIISSNGASAALQHPSRPGIVTEIGLRPHAQALKAFHDSRKTGRRHGDPRGGGGGCSWARNARRPRFPQAIQGTWRLPNGAEEPACV